jgi:hypothetical protein
MATTYPVSKIAIISQFHRREAEKFTERVELDRIAIHHQARIKTHISKKIAYTGKTL